MEPFIGGGAIFWAKTPSKVEVINDINRELINFYEMVQNDFIDLEKLVRISLHSRSLHSDAMVIYNNPHMFSRLQRAWAIWVLAHQSFSAKLNGGWGYDKKIKNTSNTIKSKRDGFSVELAERLQSVQIECTDALRIIKSLDHSRAFFYCDPPYFNSHCGHYKGYSIDDFELLLKILGSIEGKFLLSSYPSSVLDDYSRRNNWFTKTLDRKVAINNGTGKESKRKIEVLTANYELPKQ
ncbi:DNA adenine methylase [Niabella sp. W65]|nr:DNA adenine methylase [Niabella sp. W65]MCH7363962.1 DNA adenine methylase [Niabella sp. W65]